MNIGSLELKGRFFLAPMEAVNCASFRVLCKNRGASLVYTDMIDADVFKEFAEKNGVAAAINKFVNPISEEKPLAVQIGGRNVNNLLFVYEAIKDFAALIDYNVGCPLSYMLAKKGGVYLMKHPEQLYAIIKELRQRISLPFTVKLRKGWDEQSSNALEIAKELEKLGVDAIALHARTRTQGYKERADWPYVRKVKEAISIPVILSGDVTNEYMAYMALAHTKADFVMVGRGAQRNPSIFKKLKVITEMPKKPSSTYDKTAKDVRKDFNDFLILYKKFEKRNNFSEIRDHALWLATECKDNKKVSQRILLAKDEKELTNIMTYLQF